MKCNIKDNQTDEQETISLLEVYTYILTKLNKASACNTCPSKN